MKHTVKRGRAYTLEEDEYLRQNYGKIPTAMVSYNLKRPVDSIWYRAKRLGLKHSGANRHEPVAPPGELPPGILQIAADNEGFRSKGLNYGKGKAMEYQQAEYERRGL